jgi:hypothetical protein
MTKEKEESMLKCNKCGAQKSVYLPEEREKFLIAHAHSPEPIADPTYVERLKGGDSFDRAEAAILERLGEQLCKEPEPQEVKQQPGKWGAEIEKRIQEDLEKLREPMVGQPVALPDGYWKKYDPNEPVVEPESQNQGKELIHDSFANIFGYIAEHWQVIIDTEPKGIVTPAKVATCMAQVLE